MLPVKGAHAFDQNEGFVSRLATYFQRNRKAHITSQLYHSKQGWKDCQSLAQASQSFLAGRNVSRLSRGPNLSPLGSGLANENCDTLYAADLNIKKEVL